MDHGISLDTALARWAVTTPDAPFVSEVETGRVLSYGAARAAVQTLRAYLGEPGRVVGLSLPAGVPSAMTWLAALTGGHTLVPCSPDATDEEKARLGARFGVDTLVVPAVDHAFGFANPEARIITLREVEEVIGRAVAGPAPSVPAAFEGEVCLTTSGTTGEPKGIRLRAHQVAYTADQIRRRHRLKTSDRGLSVLPFFHVNAPVVSLCATLMAGATVVIAPRFSRSRFWSWIEREQITWASVVPAIVAMLLQTEPPEWLPGPLRFVRTASAPLPVTYLREFERRFGVPMIETYGLSEAAATVAANPAPPARHVPGSVGLPLGVSIRICRPRENNVSTSLADVAPGVEGEICISGPSVIAGYEGGVGASSFTDGWFRTGDLGRLDNDGYLHISGRLGDVINRGGEKIAPREVEEVLLAHPLVRDVAVVGRPDPIFGRRVVAYVVPSGGAFPDLSGTLRAYAARRLSTYKVPEEVVEVPALPRTRTGKIQRHLVGVTTVAGLGGLTDELEQDGAA